MLYVTGDTHGLIDFDKIIKFIQSHNITKNDYLFILGDAGIFWKENDHILEHYDELDVTIIFIDGNHENYTLLNNHEIVEFFGAKVHKITDHIFHILRGEILEIEGNTILCIGGGTSIDKKYRKPNITWWPQENISDEDIDNAIKNLKRYDNKVDYVFTHTSPSVIHRDVFQFWDDENVFQLDKINMIVNCKHWYFGHYHIDRVFNDMYQCFYQNIELIPEGEL